MSTSSVFLLTFLLHLDIDPSGNFNNFLVSILTKSIIDISFGYDIVISGSQISIYTLRRIIYQIWREKTAQTNSQIHFST